MDTEAFLQSHLAKPFSHCVTTLYANGTSKTHSTRSLAAAENFAKGQRQKLGRDLIDRATGESVRILAVTLSPL
jgi:hypothetical protein